MPIVTERGENESDFIDVRRVFVDSSDRSNGTVSDYEFMLPRGISNVIAIELTAFSLPTSITPSFLTGVNDAIDFSLTRGALTKTFTCRIPSNSYTYQNVAVPYLDYLRVLEQSLNSAFALDPDFGASAPTVAFFATAPDPEEKTQLYCYNANAVLLFGSGPNSSQAANVQLGFERIDYTFGNFGLLSPFRALLEPSQRIEIFIDEFPTLQPVAVIYNSSQLYYAQSQNEHFSRLRILDDNQPRVLSKLTIRVRVDGEPIEDVYKNEHSLSFTIMCFKHIDGPVPAWLKQFNGI
jgi:hypothetical protein